MELPVLRWVLAEGDGATGELGHGSGEPFAGLPDVTQAEVEDVTRLEEHALVVALNARVETSDYIEWPRLRVSADGLRVLGEWPPHDSATLQQALVAALTHFADEVSEEEARPVRRMAGGIARFAHGVVADATQGELRRLGSEAVKSVWEQRDEPVLRFLHDHPPRQGILWTNWLSEQPHASVPQLTEAEFERAVQTLHDAGYVACDLEQGEGGGGRYRQRFFVTGRGKQALGEWPRFDALRKPAELAAVLERLAELAPTEEEASNFRKTAGLLRRGGTVALGALMKGALGAAMRGALA